MLSEQATKLQVVVQGLFIKLRLAAGVVAILTHQLLQHLKASCSHTEQLVDVGNQETLPVAKVQEINVADDNSQQADSNGVTISAHAQHVAANENCAQTTETATNGIYECVSCLNVQS